MISGKIRFSNGLANFATTEYFNRKHSELFRTICRIVRLVAIDGSRRDEMPFGQSILAAFITSEVAGYIAERLNVSPKDVRLTKCVVAVGTGVVTGAITADTVGIVGTIILGAAYLGGYDPVYLVGESVGSIINSKSK